MPSERKYAERLREQAYKTLSPQLKNLEEELQGLKDSFSKGIYQIERKLEAVNQVELPTTEAVLDEIMEEVLQQKKNDEQLLASFARDIQQKETQEEILGMLLDCVNRFFPRVALFSVRGERFVGWSSRGYDDESARRFSDLSILRSECTSFGEILEERDIVQAPDLSDNDLLNFLQLQNSGARYFIPLHVLQRPVALLYVDQFEGELDDSNALSVVTDLTVLRIENIALKILYALTEHRTEERGASPSTDVVETPPSDNVPEAVPEFEAPPEETEAPEEEIAPEPESAPEVAPPPIPQVETEFSEEPELVPETDFSSEETASQETAEEPPFQEWPVSVAETEEREEAAPPPRIAISTEEEENLHADAKRFAKLLVSEIKLYNEPQVVEGRNHRDLYLRLKQDIDKSREMYEKRVTPIVSQKVDYFHDEIIRILGDNDPSLLGSDYPGPNNPE